MKNKILTIAAFLAVMAAMIGMASAVDVHINNASAANPLPFSTGFDRFTQIDGGPTNLASNPDHDRIISYTITTLSEAGQLAHNCCDPILESKDVEVEVLVDTAGHTPAIQFINSFQIREALDTDYNVMIESTSGPVPINIEFLSDPAHGFTASASGKTATWHVPSNANPYTANDVIRVTIPTDAPRGLYTFFVNVTGQTTGQRASASRSKNLTYVGTKLTKTATPASGPVPLNVQYTVTETNIGDLPLTPPILTDVPPSNFTLVGSSDGDTTKLNPGATWTFTQNETYTNCAPVTDTVTATTHPIINGSIRDDITLTENASATVTPTGCGGVPGKFKAWGLLGPKADPEKIFKVWVFSEFMPKGEVSVQDKVKNLDIQATNITSVVTDITAGKGTATGTAHVTSTGGTPPPGVPGDYNFTVNVVDAAHSGTPHGTFDITLTGTGGLSGYHNSGNMSFGVVSIIK